MTDETTAPSHDAAALTQALVAEAPYGMLVVDDAGSCVLANAAVCAILGRADHEVVGRGVDELLDLERQGHSWDRLRAAGRAEAQIDLPRSSGPAVACELIVRADVVGGRHLLTLRSLAERRRVEARHRILFDRSPLPMMIYDRGTLAVLAVNEAAVRQYGYTAEEFRRLTVRDIRPADDLDAFLSAIHDHPEAGWRQLSREGIWRHRRKDGTTFHAEIWRHFFEYEGHDATLVLALDVTERVGAEEALRRSEEQLRHALRMEAIGRLAGGVAHDFNNLLTVIIGYAEFLRRGAERPDVVRRNADEIRRAADRASALTRQLLAFSRKQILQPKVLDLNEIVDDMTKMLDRLIGEDIHLRLRLGEHLPRVKADPGQIEQVIANLTVNARDAMPDGGTLTIETSAVDYREESSQTPPGRYVTLVISDTGLGMDRVTLERIFEPFYTTKELGKGTGLGLSTVYGIVKQSGGFIWVYSEPGLGTTFKIYLPAVETPPDAQDAEGPVALDAARGTETILIAEDEDGVRALARSALSDLGYTVLEARNGEEAYLIGCEYGGRIDLLLADVVMPAMSGKQLADRLAGPRPEMKVLYISGYTEDAIVHHGVLDEGVEFLEKPFTVDALARRIRQVLG